MAAAPVFIVVTTFNGQEDMPDFLRTLKETTRAEDIYLIVVDNVSHDATVAIVEREYPSAEILRNTTNTGFAGGMNRGMSYALAHGAEHIFLVNQDIRFEGDWLSPLVRILRERPTVAAVQPLIHRYPEKELINAYGDALHYLGFGYAYGDGTRVDQLNLPDYMPVAYCSFAAVLLSADALRKVGLFDDTYFMYHEDSDLCWRFRLRGLECLATRQSHIYHRYEFTRSIQKFYWIERNRLQNLIRNYELKTLILILPMLLFWECGLLAYALLGTLTSTRTIGLKEKFRAYAYFLKPKTWRHLLRHRKAIQSSRVIPDREIVSLFTADIAFQDIQNPLLSRVANPITRAYWRCIRPLL